MGYTIDEWPGNHIDDSNYTIIISDEATQLFPGYRLRSP